MPSQLQIRSLKPVDLTEMYLAFLDSFADYEVPFKLTKEQFVRKFVEKLKIDFQLSIAAFDHEERLAGFIFSTVNYYEGKLSAYNGGTGVRPGYRGRNLTAKMYQFLVPILRERKVKQCVLEVLTRNARAIRAYKSIGFRETKYFRCFKLSNRPLEVYPPAVPVEFFSVKSPRWELYETFADHHPSFLDSSLMINQNLANETVIEAHFKGKCVGYAIFQSVFGRISQIAVAPEMRRNGIGANMIRYIYMSSHQKSLTVINVDQKALVTQIFFQSLGFENQLDQYEMILSLE